MNYDDSFSVLGLLMLQMSWLGSNMDSNSVRNEGKHKFQFCLGALVLDKFLLLITPVINQVNCHLLLFLYCAFQIGPSFIESTVLFLKLLWLISPCLLTKATALFYWQLLSLLWFSVPISKGVVIMLQVTKMWCLREGATYREPISISHLLSSNALLPSLYVTIPLYRNTVSIKAFIS